jgi:hypothetical protein
MKKERKNFKLTIIFILAAILVRHPRQRRWLDEWDPLKGDAFPLSSLGELISVYLF